MSRYNLAELRDTSWPTLCMWTWFIASTIGVGVLFGNAFSTGYREEFNAGAMFGGFIVGAIGCLPAMAFFNVLLRILQSQHALHSSPAAAPRGVRSTPAQQSTPSTTRPDSLPGGGDRGTAPRADSSTPAQQSAPSTTQPVSLPPLPGGGGRGTAPRPSDRRWGSGV